MNMAKKLNATPLTIQLPDDGQTTKMLTQYGMRYPDGTIKWVAARTPNASSVNFEDLAKGYTDAQQTWDTALLQNAQQARVDLDEYKESHYLVKRTIVVAVTEFETA